MIITNINFFLSNGLPYKPHHQGELSTIYITVAILIVFIIITKICPTTSKTLDGCNDVQHHDKDFSDHVELQLEDTK